MFPAIIMLWSYRHCSSVYVLYLDEITISYDLQFIPNTSHHVRVRHQHPGGQGEWSDAGRHLQRVCGRVIICPYYMFLISLVYNLYLYEIEIIPCQASAFASFIQRWIFFQQIGLLFVNINRPAFWGEACFIGKRRKGGRDRIAKQNLRGALHQAFGLNKST